MALKNAKVPAELHIYAQGGHVMACAGLSFRHHLAQKRGDMAAHDSYLPRQIDRRD